MHTGWVKPDPNKLTWVILTPRLYYKAKFKSDRVSKCLHTPARASTCFQRDFDSEILMSTSVKLENFSLCASYLTGWARRGENLLQCACFTSKLSVIYMSVYFCGITGLSELSENMKISFLSDEHFCLNHFYTYTGWWDFREDIFKF